MHDTRPGAVDAERLEAMVDDLATRLAELPESALTHRAGPEDWTAAEVIGHMTEMMPYWARVAAAVAAEPGRTFGREPDDPDRVGAVRAVNGVPRAELLARLRSAAHEAANAIKLHDADAWAAEGVHPRYGRMTVGALIDALLVEHAAGHVRQALEAAGVPPDG